MIDVKFLNKSANKNPEYKTSGAAGFDIAVSEDVTLEGGSSVLLSTGLHFVIPEGYEGQLRLRSSMAKQGVVIPNAPGTIDSDYRGEVKIPIRNLNHHTPFSISAGERIAQLVINEVPRVRLSVVTELEWDSYRTDRGSGGFGSTN